MSETDNCERASPHREEVIFTPNRLELAHKITGWLFSLAGQVAKGRGVTKEGHGNHEEAAALKKKKKRTAEGLN